MEESEFQSQTSSLSANVRKYPTRRKIWRTCSPTRSFRDNEDNVRSVAVSEVSTRSFDTTNSNTGILLRICGILRIQESTRGTRGTLLWTLQWSTAAQTGPGVCSFFPKTRFANSRGDYNFHFRLQTRDYHNELLNLAIKKLNRNFTQYLVICEGSSSAIYTHK